MFKKTATRALMALLLLASALTAAPAVLADIGIQGSTTVQPISEASEPQYEFEYSSIDISVAGGGSGHGCKGILNDLFDIGNASSNMNASHQVEYGGAQGFFLMSDVDDNVIARDGVAIVVRNVPEMDFLTCVTKSQIDQIYEGTLTNWNQIVEGVNQSIVPRARIIGSGTRASLLEIVGITDATEQSTITATGQPRLDGNPEMALAIAANTYHLGYVGLAFTGEPGLRVVPVDGGSGCVAGTFATVENGTYPISRVLHKYTLKQSIDPSWNPEVPGYIAWILSPKGQALVEKEGFVPVQPAAPDWDVNADHNCNIGDVVTVGLAWGQSGPSNGWLRQDTNSDKNVNIGDVVFVGLYWGQGW